MSSVKKAMSDRGYRLIFVPFMGGEDYRICYYEALNLEEIDWFTSRFDNLDDMIAKLNKRLDNKIDIVSSYIERIGGKKTRYDVLYHGDFFDYDKVIYEYRNYLLGHQKYFYRISPVHFVNLHREDYRLEKDYIEACCHAYFADMNYRKLRGAYLELKKLGLSKKVITADTDIDMDDVQYSYYSNNDDLDELLNRGDQPDWDEIYSRFDFEDINSLVKKEPKNSSGRGRG